MLSRDAVVAVGVSGGKDSVAVALAVARHLDAIGHQGPRLLIHSDLGRVEWLDSLPACERLAAHLGWELVVVKRKAGDTRYGVSRVSCAFCIMSAWADLLAACTCEDNRSLYVSMVELEAVSTFGFQGNRWLAEVMPAWLPDDLKIRVEWARACAQERQRLEKLLPKHLHYTKGWPTVLPTAEEADLIAHVRRGVAAVMRVEVKHTTGAEVRARYQQLLDLKAARGAQDTPCETL